MSPRTNLIALRDAREKTIELLTQRYAEDIIDGEEFETRLDVAEAARTLEVLDELVDDLVDPNLPPLEAALSKRKPSAVVSHLDVPRTQTLFSIFSETKRQGTWTPARELKSFAAFGSNVLDFREARLGPGAIRIRVLNAICAPVP